jgi:hypothetical protein
MQVIRAQLYRRREAFNPVFLVSCVAVLANCEPEVRFTDGGLFAAKERMSQTCIVTSRSVGSPPAAAAGFVMCIACSRVLCLASLDQVGRLSLPVRRRKPEETPAGRS